MSQSIPEPDSFLAQTGFDDAWQHDALNGNEFEADEFDAEDELDIEEDRAHER